MHAASDQTADVHCLELRTGDFVQFVPPNANAAALDCSKVAGRPRLQPAARSALWTLRLPPALFCARAPCGHAEWCWCDEQVYSDLDALQRAVRVNVTYKLLPSLSSNGKNENAPQQAQSCHLQVPLLSVCCPVPAAPRLRIVPALVPRDGWRGVRQKALKCAVNGCSHRWGSVPGSRQANAG